MGILVITGGCSMAAMIFKVPPQCGQCSLSISNTRLRKLWGRARSGTPPRPRPVSADPRSTPPTAGRSGRDETRGRPRTASRGVARSIAGAGKSARGGASGSSPGHRHWRDPRYRAASRWGFGDSYPWAGRGDRQSGSSRDHPRVPPRRPTDRNTARPSPWARTMGSLDLAIPANSTEGEGRTSTMTRRASNCSERGGAILNPEPIMKAPGGQPPDSETERRY